MKKIIVGCCKGGVSKTTTATGLSVALAQMGKSVFLLDADYISNSCKWSEYREESGFQPPITVSTRRGNVTGFLRSLEDGAKYDYCIIDVSGSASKEMISAMAVADVLLVPLTCSQYDFQTLLELEAEINTAREVFQNEAMKVLLFQSRGVTHAGRVKERLDFVRMAGDFPDMTLLKTIGTERKSYRSTATSGLSVVEMDDAAANAEINSLVEEVLRHA